jgi:hypothetical protein
MSVKPMVSKSRLWANPEFSNISSLHSRRNSLTSHAFGSPAPVKVEPQAEPAARSAKLNFSDYLDRHRRAIYSTRRAPKFAHAESFLQRDAFQNCNLPSAEHLVTAPGFGQRFGVRNNRSRAADGSRRDCVYYSVRDERA